jgi:hypothetical protein
MKIVDLKEHKSKVNDKTMDNLIAELGKLKEAITDGRLKQVVVQYDADTVDDDVQEAPEARHLVFWNKEEDFDQIVGFCQRLLFQMTLMSESLSE